MWHNGTNLCWVGPVSVWATARLFFFHCLRLRDTSGGIPAAKTLLSGSGLGQLHCPTLISYKGPSSINVRAKSFYAFLYRPREKGLFSKQPANRLAFCAEREQRGIMSWRANWRRGDVAGWLWLCPDNAVLSGQAENVVPERVNIHRLALTFVCLFILQISSADSQ